MKRLIIIYSLISLAIVGPLLGRGYILTLDMVFTPTLRMPSEIGSSYLFHALLHFANMIVPADILQKILLFGTFLLAGGGAHWLARELQSPPSTKWYSRVGRLIGGVFYVINPFTYERLMTGQYAVLLGYALLPWFTGLLLRGLRQPSWPATMRTTLVAVAVGIVSIHSLGPVAIVAIIGLIGAVSMHHQDWQQYLQQAAIGIAAFALLSCYWLSPLLTGTSHAAHQIAAFGSGDQLAFATTGGNLLEKVLNVLLLRGFWAERHELFILPWSALGPVWLLLALLIIAIVALGLTKYWHAKGSARTTAVFVTVIIVTGVLLAGGLPSTGLLAGFREPQKFAMLVALGYSLGLTAGATALLKYWSEQFSSLLSRATAVAVLFALPLIWSSVLLWGCHGQLSPRQYPAGWSAVNTALTNSLLKNERTVFLPWHLYLHTDFAGRTIANPAPDFFDKPTLISSDPELDGVSSLTTDSERQLDRLIRNKPPDFTTQLQKLGIDYIILAKETDYQQYLPFLNQPNIHLVAQTATINLYRITQTGGK